MIPQPEESPDEILARRIEHAKQRIEFYSAENGNKDEDAPYRKLAANCRLEWEQDLAMLEAMRASRPGLKALTDIANWFGEKLPDDYNIMSGSVKLTLGQCRQAREAYRQSDDAIRGMR